MSDSRLQRRGVVEPHPGGDDPPPAAGGVDHHRRRDRALVGLHAGHAAPLHKDPGGAHALAHGQSPGPGRRGQQPGGGQGVGVPGARLEDTGPHLLQVDHGEAVPQRLDGEFLHGHAQLAFHVGHLPAAVQVVLFEQGQVAGLPEAAGTAEGLLRVGEHAGGAHGQADGEGIGVEGADGGGRVPGADRGEGALLQHHHRSETQPGEEVGGADAEDAAPDDDGVGGR